MTALALADVRWRSRRNPAGGAPLVSAGFLSEDDGRRLEPIIAGIAGYLDGLRGRRRRDFDADVPVAIAGDRRLGRSLTAVCLDWYRWHTPTFAEALPEAVVAALGRAGITTPSALRLALFDLANRDYPGFVPSAGRDAALADLARSLGVDAEHAALLDPALTLDAEEEAILRRDGGPPAMEDVLARYNRALLAALLRQATRVVVTLQQPTGSLLRRAYALCRRLGVYVDVERAPTLTETFRLTLVVRVRCDR
jgi:hypothetical protein